MEIRVTVAEEEYLLWSADSPFGMGVMKCSKDTPYIKTILNHLNQEPGNQITGFTFDSESLEILDVTRTTAKSSDRTHTKV